MNKMKLDSGISDICLWNNKYIFASYNESIFPKFKVMIYVEYVELKLLVMKQRVIILLLPL